MRFVKRNFHIRELARTYSSLALVVVLLIFLLVFLRYIYVSRSVYSETVLKDKVSKLYGEFTRGDAGLFDIQDGLADNESMVYRESVLIKCKYVSLQLELKMDCSDYNEISKKHHGLINTTRLTDEYAIAVLMETEKTELKLLKEMEKKDRRNILKLQDFYIEVVHCVRDKECHKGSAVRYFGESIYSYVNRFCAYLKYDSDITNQKPRDDILVAFLIENHLSLPESMFKGADGSVIPFGFRCGRHGRMLPKEAWLN